MPIVAHVGADVAPARPVFLDPQQVRQQQAVEVAQRRVSHGGDPLRDAFRRVVAGRVELDGPGPRAAQLARVGVGDELLVRVRGEHRLDLLPEILERRLLSELRRGDFVLRQGQQLPLAIGVGHERLERLGQAVGRPALRDDGVRDEAGDRRVAHAMDHRADDVDVAGHRFRLGPAREQVEHRLRRQPPRDLPDLPQRLIELPRVGLADVFGQAAEDVQERADADRERHRALG